MKNRINFKKLILGLIMLSGTVALSYADTTGTVHNFKDWASGIVSFIEQIKTFIQIIATLIGMWFVFSALQLFRKHHTTQGAQGEHVKHGAGHLILGICLICLVPGIQMLQSTFGNDLGEGVKSAFSVDSNIFNGAK